MQTLETTLTAVRPDLRAMNAYPVADATGMVKLDVMENPFTLPEWLAREVGDVVTQLALNRYPVPSAPALRARLREVMAIPSGSELMVGNGSDELIAVVTMAVAQPGAKILAPVPAFPMYKLGALFNYAEFIGVPLRADFTLDLDATLAAIEQHRPALIWLAYPNNPTGNLFPDAAVEAIIKAAPGLVVVDEAYQPFAKKTWMPRLPEFPQLIVMRTVSKIGLAGLRLGYMAGGPALFAELDKVRPPYNVSVVTQAIAEKLLQHNDVFETQCAQVSADRDRLFPLLKALPGVTPFESAANFILARVPDAPKIYASMKAQKVLVKSFHGAHPLLDNTLRLTVGKPDENAAMLSALKSAL